MQKSNWREEIELDEAPILPVLGKVAMGALKVGAPIVGGVLAGGGRLAGGVASGAGSVVVVLCLVLVL